MARVGLCEDDVAIRRVVTDAMRLAGHDVVAAHDGGEALRLFVDDDALDVVILDIGLPDADGRDVCQALRSAGQSYAVARSSPRRGRRAVRSATTRSTPTSDASGSSCARSTRRWSSRRCAAWDTR